MSKVQGTVKWFSNQKGYGFITPTSENSPTEEDVFVHQSGVVSEGYRTLVSAFSCFRGMLDLLSSRDFGQHSKSSYYFYV